MTSIPSDTLDLLKRHPFSAAAVVAGIASVAGNVAFNCSTCGWDLHSAAWYEAFLVAGVPLVVAPLGVIAAAIHVAFMRSRSSLAGALSATLGLALPWLYWLGRFLLDVWPSSSSAGAW